MPAKKLDAVIFNNATGAAEERSAMTTRHKIIAVLAGAILLVSIGVAVSFWAFRQIEEAAAVRKHTYAVLDGANALLSEIKDAETGQRGYLLTGDETFLDTYTLVRNRIPDDLEKLRQLTLLEAAHHHLDSVVPLVSAKLVQMAQVIELRRNHEVAASIALIRSSQGKRLMDGIRAEMKLYTQLEEEVLAQREAEFEASMRNLFGLIVATILLALLFAVAFVYLLHRESRQRIKNLVHLETQYLLKIQEETNKQLQQINDTLQVSEERLAVTLNSIGDAVMATDSDARVSLMNPLAEKLTGWTRAEAIGRPVDDIFNIINQETRQPSTIPVKETLAHGTVQGLANHTILIARDGGECAIADSCAPIRDRNDRIVGAVLVFRDVTLEYAVQKALHDQQFYTRSLIESNVDALMTTDSFGVITDVNEEMVKLTGCMREDMFGTPFKSYFTDPKRAEDGINLVLSENNISNYELTVRAKDGKETVVSCNATTFHDRDGKLQGVFAAARDVTERKRLDQVLHEKNIELERATFVAEKANLAKSVFLSRMSHELRTPLNAILGFAQLLEAGSPPPTPAQLVRLHQIINAGWYLLDLINEILDLALIEAGRLSLSREPVSLNDVLSECRVMIESQVQQRGIELIFPRFDIPCYVSADRTRLKQVLINLLTNALKYNRPQGMIEVKCIATTTDCIRISIRDSGAGLPPEKLLQLFQPFNRLGQENGAEEGTGIGLVVAKQLIELMGGSIGVKSVVGVGSEFWIELIGAVKPELADKNNVPAYPVSLISGQTALRTLLYVEDNPANLMLVEQIIADHPQVRMLSARDGSVGIAIARTHLPDVILMDINLPGISGFEAMAILRKDPDTAHIPVVALSANAMLRDIEKGLEAGFFRYLTKPIKINEFMNALDDALKYSETKLAHVNENDKS